MAKLSALIKNYKGDLREVAKSSALELSNRVHDGTPIDIGDARKRWIADGGFGAGQSYTYLNNIEYIEKLEYGHSDQAPQGMLRTNVRNWQSIVDKHVNK